MSVLFLAEVKNKDDIESCSSFWTCVMPKVIEQIQQNDAAILKSICCDALSNIGSHVFERLEVTSVPESFNYLIFIVFIILA